MRTRLANGLLLAFVVALLATGLAGWVLPAGLARPLYDLHRALGVATLLLVLVRKQAIVRASLRRRLRRPAWDRSIVPGLVSATCLVGSLGLGLAWTLGLVTYDSFLGYSPLNLHVALGIGLGLPLLWHALGRRAENRAGPPPEARRAVLGLAGLTVATLAGWRAVERVAEAVAPVGSRQPSGSRHAGSFTGNAFPVTNWLLDPVPVLDPAAWRLTVAGRVAEPGPLALADLRTLPRRQTTAVLDCTGGWWSEQVWSGVAVGDLLAARGLDGAASLAIVVSVTGHGWVFPVDELRSALLATHVGGEPLSPAHGFPVRLVVPGRRGVQWVKWVGHIEVR